MRAPLAPPRMSVPRNVDAEAHAVDASCDTVRPESRIRVLRSAISSALIVPAGGAGTGSCQISSSAGTSGAEVAGHRTHVAVGELEPGAGEGISQLFGVLMEAPLRSARRSGRSVGPGPWSALSERGACWDRGHRALCCRQPDRSDATAGPPAGLSVNSHS